MLFRADGCFLYNLILRRWRLGCFCFKVVVSSISARYLGVVIFTVVAASVLLLQCVFVLLGLGFLGVWWCDLIVFSV